MNKSRLTVFIFVLVLIAFITAVLISESTVRNRTQCVTVIHSAENAAATTSKTDTAKAATEPGQSRKSVTLQQQCLQRQLPITSQMFRRRCM